GLSPQDRAVLQQNLAAGQPVPQKLQGAAAAALEAKDLVMQQVQTLPAEEQRKVFAQLGQENGWPLTRSVERALDQGLQRSPQQLVGMPQAPMMPRLSGVVQNAVLDGRLDVHEMANVLRAASADAQAAAQQGPQAMGVAHQQFDQLMQFLRQQA